MTRYITDINTATPDGADLLAQGDDEIRTLKSDVLNSFPKIAGEVSASHSNLNKLAGFVGNVVSDAGGSITGTFTFTKVVNLDGDISVSGGSNFVGTAHFGADITVSATLCAYTYFRNLGRSLFDLTASFAASPVIPSPSDNNHAASKGYVDAAVVGGGSPGTVGIHEFKQARLKLFYYGQL